MSGYRKNDISDRYRGQVNDGQLTSNSPAIPDRPFKQQKCICSAYAFGHRAILRSAILAIGEEKWDIQILPPPYMIGAHGMLAKRSARNGR